MRAAKISALGIMAAAVLATAAPATAQAPAFRNYVACGTTAKAQPSHFCPLRRASAGKVGAFFRSHRADVKYGICVNFPGPQAPRCARRQEAVKGKLYVNPITSNQTGKHVVSWFVKAKRVGRFVFYLR